MRSDKSLKSSSEPYPSDAIVREDGSIYLSHGTAVIVSAEQYNEYKRMKNILDRLGIDYGKGEEGQP